MEKNYPPPPRINTFQTFVKSLEPVIYTNACNENLSTVLQQAIESAKHGIFLRAYRLTSTEILEILAKQAEAKRTVFLHYQFTTHNFALEKVAQIKVKTHPPHSRKLMHQKALAVDDQYAWIGTANYTQPSLLQDSNVIVGFKSPKLCEFIKKDISGFCLVGNQPVSYYSLPNDKHLAFHAILFRLKTAQKVIQVAMLALTHVPIIRELQLAKQRGVHVEAIIDKDFSYECLDRLHSIRSTFPVHHKVTPFKLHCKLCIIDQTTLIVGSLNWSKNGFCSNSENVLILDKLTTAQQSKLNLLWGKLKMQSECIYSGTQDRGARSKKGASPGKITSRSQEE